MNTRPITVFCDLDGTLIEHDPANIAFKENYKMKPLSGSLEKLSEWDRKGYYIVLTTGRKESLRKLTEEQLTEVGIFYDQLVMGIGSGMRYLINDKKPDGSATAFALCLERNQGLSKINI